MSAASKADDGAALLRVRNRLADTPDAKLPTVLHKLLPRLVSRFSTSNSDGVGISVDPNLAGIFEHIRERVLLNPKGLLKSELVSSLLEAIEPNGSWTHYKYALPILEVALVPCDIEGALPKLIDILEDIHAQSLVVARPSSGVNGTSTAARRLMQAARLTRRLRGEDNEDVDMEDAPDPNQLVSTEHQEGLKEVWERASWIVVEQIAKKSSLQPVLDWNYLGDNWDDLSSSANLKKITEYNPAEGESAAARDGFYSLFIDLLTYDPQERQGHPSRWQFRRQTQAMKEDFDHMNRQHAAERELLRRNNDTTRNMLIQQNHRPRNDPEVWNEAELRYWRALQRCAQAYAVQLFGQEREDVLRILTGQEKPIVSLNPYKRPKASDMYKQKQHNQRKVAARRLQEQQKESRRHNIAVGSALLHLVLGDERAKGALEQRGSQPTHVGLLGSYPFRKGPLALPPPIAQRIFSYLLTAELDLKSNTTGGSDPEILSVTGTSDLDAFLDLLKELNNVHSLQVRISNEIYEHIGAHTPPPMCWTIHFLWKVSSSQAAASLNLSQRAWDAAAKMLDQLQDFSMQRFERERRLASSGASQYRLIHEHREKQALQNRFVGEALKARSEAYQLAAKYMTEERILSADGAFSWESAVRMLNCAAFDVSKDTLTALQATCIQTLSIYQKAVSTASKETAPINSLLLPLLKASISASDWSREFVLQWTEGVLFHVDPGLSRVIVECLTSDEVPSIAGSARKALQRVPAVEEQPPSEASMVSFFDLKRDTDKDSIQKDLHCRISAVMEARPGLTPASALFVLQEFNFSTQAATTATQEDLGSALSRCGYAQTPVDASAMDTDEDAGCCEVCYEDIPLGEGFALRCKHQFCLQCWREGLQAAANASAKELVQFSCLRHDCLVRAAREDVMNIHPLRVKELEQAMLEHFVVSAKDFTFCPGADCTSVARCPPSVSDLGQEASCNVCTSSFCVQCGSDPHSPATCAVRLEYQTASDRVKAHHDSVEKKTIDCPQCGVGITKNGGCNHMTCSMCGHEFCWICLSANWQDHVCNVMDGLTGVDNLERVQFFSRRVGAHQDSCEAAKELLENFEDHAQDLLSSSRFFDDSHTYTLKMAWETLVASRTYLANSYIAAYGMTSMDATVRHEFQTHQSQLQLFIEQLSLLSDNVRILSQISNEQDFQRRFKGIHFCCMAVMGYIQRVDSFIKRSFYKQ